jgi:splicing suppressor protein 51
LSRPLALPPSSTPRTFTSSTALSARDQFEPAAPTGWTKMEPSALDTSPPLVSPDDLFHPFSASPVPEFRRRAVTMRQNGYCPHPDHKLTRLPTVVAPKKVDDAGAVDAAEPQRQGHLPPAHVDFECPDCGLPVYCSREHWMDHYEEHLEVCDTLRQINEDDHYLKSQRVFREAVLPEQQLEEAVVNMMNWDTYMYTREHEAVHSERGMRQITRLLTYPVTIASVLHELSPYRWAGGLGNSASRVTAEGVKSFAALQYNLHPSKERLAQLQPPAVRVFVLGARAESSLPRPVWLQLSHLFPDAKIHIVMVGPESMQGRDAEFPLPPRTASNPFGAVVEDELWYNLKISTFVDYYHTIHKTGYFAPYDPYFDCFVLFHPGLGHPASRHEWAETLPQLLETKVPVICTGYTRFDMERDIRWVSETAKGEFDVLLRPGENTFRSLRWDLNDLDPQDVSCANWGVWAFRGKRCVASWRREEGGGGGGGMLLTVCVQVRDDAARRQCRSAAAGAGLRGRDSVVLCMYLVQVVIRVCASLESVESVSQGRGMPHGHRCIYHGRATGQ